MMMIMNASERVCCAKLTRMMNRWIRFLIWLMASLCWKPPPTTYAGHRWSWFSPWWWRRLDKVHWHRYHDGHGHDNVQDISIQFHAIFWENLAFSEDSKAAKPHLMMRWFAAVSDPAEGGERIIVPQDFGCKHPGVNFWNGRIAVSSVMKTMCIQ